MLSTIAGAWHFWICQAKFISLIGRYIDKKYCYTTLQVLEKTPLALRENAEDIKM